MAKQFYSLLTTYGCQQLANALANRTPLDITTMAVGDGNGTATTPDANKTSLAREVYRANISAISLDPRNNKQIIFELTIPENVGGFYIREMGIFDSQNKLIAYANCPDSFKPSLESGSGKVQVLRMILLVNSSEAVTLKVDNSVIFATKGQLTPKQINANTNNAVDDNGHTHAINHATTGQKGITQLTNDTGLDSETLALTAKAGKALSQRIAQNQQAIAGLNSGKVDKTAISNAVNSTSQTDVASSQAVKTAYDKAVEANTNANGRVSKSGDTMTGLLTINTPASYILGKDGSSNKWWFGRGDADSDDITLMANAVRNKLTLKSDRTESEKDLFVKNNKVYHQGNKPRFGEDIQNKPTTLDGYGITNFKIEQSTGNANDFKVDGNYYFASGQNLPDSNAWHIEVVSGGQADAVRQIARKANETKIKTRFFNGSSWSSWKDTGGDGVPLGAVVAFPKEITHPQGFLLANGTTFSQQTYPDLYRTLGNKNILPNLQRSDVGMTAYFAADNIPDGWIPFDSIRTTVTQQEHPELYQHLVAKYGSISSVPLAEDRFIRNAGSGLTIGSVQGDAIRNITGELKAEYGGNIYALYTKATGVFRVDGREAYRTFSAANQSGLKDKIIFDASRAVPTANENRPKSIVLKLCIKAKNSFDDVRFWIKAFGEVENVGVLDAGRLAQDIQDVKGAIDRLSTIPEQLKSLSKATEIIRLERQVRDRETSIEDVGSNKNLLRIALFSPTLVERLFAIESVRQKIATDYDLLVSVANSRAARAAWNSNQHLYFDQALNCFETITAQRSSPSAFINKDSVSGAKIGTPENRINFMYLGTYSSTSNYVTVTMIDSNHAISGQGKYTQNYSKANSLSNMKTNKTNVVKVVTFGEISSATESGDGYLCVATFVLEDR